MRKNGKKKSPLGEADNSKTSISIITERGK